MAGYFPDSTSAVGITISNVGLLPALLRASRRSWERARGDWSRENKTVLGHPGRRAGAAEVVGICAGPAVGVPRGRRPGESAQNSQQKRSPVSSSED